MQTTRNLPIEQFAVVLDRYEPPPREKLAALFQAVCGLPRLDATTKAARASGIIAEKLDNSKAEALQRALGNLQYPARLMAQAALPESVKGRRVQWLSADETHLSVRWSPTGPVDFYEWSSVLVVSAAVVHHIAKEQVLRTIEERGLLSGARGSIQIRTEVTQRDASRDMAMATVTLIRNAQFETLRFRGTELEYATMLGAQVKLSPLENFCLLLARLGTYATEALITDETIELISAAAASPRLPRGPRFESEDEFDHYQRWLVARRLLSS